MWKGSKRDIVSRGVLATPYFSLSPFLTLPFPQQHWKFFSPILPQRLLISRWFVILKEMFSFPKPIQTELKFCFDLLLQCAQKPFTFEVSFIVTSGFTVLIWIMADFASLSTKFEKKIFLSWNTLNNHWLCAF